MKLLAITTIVALLSIAPAHAGPFENANAYYGNKYGVPDFTFTKAEFGNTNLGRLIHLGIDVLVEHFHGATVVYNPATGEVLVWGDSGAPGDDFNPDVIPNKFCGPDAPETATRDGGYCDYATSNATLAPSVGGPYLKETIPAVARSCTFDAKSDDIDVHHC